MKLKLRLETQNPNLETRPVVVGSALLSSIVYPRFQILNRETHLFRIKMDAWMENTRGEYMTDVEDWQIGDRILTHLSASPNVHWAVMDDMQVWDYPAVVTDIIQRDGSTTWLVQYDNGGKAETTCAGDLHPPLVCGSSVE